MQTGLTVLGWILGLGLIASGVLAIVRGHARASSEGEETRSYEGGSAGALGAVWIFLGLSAIAASSGIGPGFMQWLGRVFLDG